MKYILILTLSYYRGGGAIDHIYFSDRASCMTAAKFWLDHSALVYAMDSKSAVCVGA